MPSETIPSGGGGFFEELLSSFPPVAQVFPGSAEGSGIASSFDVVVLVLQMLSVAISIVLIVGIVILLRRSHAVGKTAHTVLDAVTADIPHDRIAERWEGIRQALASDRPNDWRLAVIDADRLLENTLRYFPLGGETLAEKLKEFDRSELSVIDDVWRAHKLRNALVHGDRQDISREEATQAARAIGAALRELGVLA